MFRVILSGIWCILSSGSFVVDLLKQTIINFVSHSATVGFLRSNSLNFVMAPCKRQVKATGHLICNSCSNWVDFVKSGCEKSWAEVQADSFSFECRGCTRMKELEVELEQLRLLIVAVVGREQVGCVSGSGGGTLDDKVGEDDEIGARESSLQPGRRLRGHKVTCRRETGRKETRRKEMGGKTNGSKERGVEETVATESGRGARRR